MKARVPLLGYGGARSLTRAYAPVRGKLVFCLSFGKGIVLSSSAYHYAITLALGLVCPRLAVLNKALVDLSTL